jgi:outer membrane protein assembly factor BamA
MGWLSSCNQTKYVPKEKFLLKKNKLDVNGGPIDEASLTAIIRQKPNFKTLGIKMKLWAYNQVDSSKVANKRIRINQELRMKNKQRLSRQSKINNRRIVKARRKGKKVYSERIVQLKDTVNPRMFLREWFKYKIGEKPIVFDSIPYNKSIDQLEVFLRNKGFYFGKVKGSVDYQKKQKVKVNYHIETGPQFKIDSVYLICSNIKVKEKYNNFVKNEENGSLLGVPFDKDYLNNYRDRLAKYMRNGAMYGFSSSHVLFVADTNRATMSVKLGVQLTDRLVRSELNRDSLIAVKHRETKVRNVYFHIADTTFYSGDFKSKLEELGLSLLDNQFVRTVDTFYYAEVEKNRSDELDPYRKATFLYNGKLTVDPDVIELQNYLEETNFYKEYYLERSYTRLIQLGLFQVIKPVVIEVPGSPQIDVHYYLVPSKKQSIDFEPRATNSNGFLGVAASLFYTNKNLFGGAEKLVLTLSGGFESQPPVFDETLDGQKTSERTFNTFEFGPSIKFDIPGLFPSRVTSLSKRQRPRTIISTAYNFQNRVDFSRQIFQLNYLWRFYVGKTQLFQLGLPGMSTVKFVSIQNTDEFQKRLDDLNDIFLKNAYSDQFVWQDLKLTFEYNNKERDERKGNFLFYMNTTFDPSGNVLSLFKNRQDTLENGQHTIFGVGYSQFARLDNDVIVSNPIGKKNSVHGRLLLGAGIPYGNTVTSLPYDYSFFAGGANDNRGWRARALGPGSYKYYLDTNRTATQIGDIRIGTSLEFRFSLGDMIKGGAFIDAGNVWTLKEDVNRIGGQFTSNWYKEIAVSAGLGLRLDLDFFIVRLDVGIPVTNPALPDGERWIFQTNRPQFIKEATDKFGPNYAQFVPKLFIPTVHFGIGYPF